MVRSPLRPSVVSFSARFQRRSGQLSLGRNALRPRIPQRQESTRCQLPQTKSNDVVDNDVCSNGKVKLTKEVSRLPWKPAYFAFGCIVSFILPPRVAWVLIGVLACALAGHFGNAVQNISASIGLGLSLSLCATTAFYPQEITNGDFAAMFAVIVLLFIARSTVQTIWMKAELESREVTLKEKQSELNRQTRRLEKHAQEKAQEYASVAVKQAWRRAKTAEGVAKGLRKRFNEDNSVACKICFDRPASCALLPCKHLGFCRECAEYLASSPDSKCRCPLCRAPVVSIFEGYPA